ncbi:ribokinase [Lacibacterium aquatile]|uniref:Deoxyribokinase n=1 Tax=Lacibacterium aquatile TaxID=1168082 RepID=A0ABW5DRA8_9PROT
MPGRLTVIASFMQDVSLAIPRSPLAGETMFAGDLTLSAGGKGSNQAVQAARCGAEVAVVAAVGQDGGGDGALQVWQKEGIDTQHVTRIDGVATGTAIILVEPSGENRIILAAGANSSLHPKHADAAADIIATSGLVIAQLESPLETVERAFAIARAAGVPTLINTAPAPDSLPDSLWQLTDYVVSNRIEASQLTGLPEETALEELARALKTKVGRAALLTAGAEGAIAIDQTGNLLRQPALPAKVIDTTGAGDAFIGAVAAALVAGASLAQAMEDGVAAGALACEGRGVVPSLARKPAINDRKRLRR